MKHVRDISITDATVLLQTRRARLFALCHQQVRAVESGLGLRARPEIELSDAELDAIRQRAVQSLARPA